MTNELADVTIIHAEVQVRADNRHTALGIRYTIILFQDESGLNGKWAEVDTPPIHIITQDTWNFFMEFARQRCAMLGYNLIYKPKQTP